jgi:hypothetical protein
MAKKGGYRPGAGRPIGSRNKIGVELRDIAQKYTGSAIRTLVGLMNDEGQPGAVRVAAAGQLLDRGHGRPHQTQDTTITEQRSFVIAPRTASKQEWDAICAANRARVFTAQPNPKPIAPNIAGKKLPPMN